jgi:hypothetical protein
LRGLVGIALVQPLAQRFSLIVTGRASHLFVCTHVYGYPAGCPDDLVLIGGVAGRVGWNLGERRATRLAVDLGASVMRLEGQDPLDRRTVLLGGLTLSLAWARAGV